MNAIDYLKNGNLLLQSKQYDLALVMLNKCKHLVPQGNNVIQNWLTVHIQFCEKKSKNLPASSIRDDIKLKSFARMLGYDVRNKKDEEMGELNYFVTQNRYIWSFISSNGIAWKCADLLDNYFCNHRTYKILSEALLNEYK